MRPHLIIAYFIFASSTSYCQSFNIPMENIKFQAVIDLQNNSNLKIIQISTDFIQLADTHDLFAAIIIIINEFQNVAEVNNFIKGIIDTPVSTPYLEYTIDNRELLYVIEQYQKEINILKPLISIIDPYQNFILQFMLYCNDEANEINIKNIIEFENLIRSYIKIKINANYQE